MSKGFVVCLSNRGYPASLQVRKAYRQIADPEAAQQGFVRVIDESGEDYLFPAAMFTPKRRAATTPRRRRRS